MFKERVSRLSFMAVILVCFSFYRRMWRKCYHQMIIMVSREEAGSLKVVHTNCRLYICLAFIRKGVGYGIYGKESEVKISVAGGRIRSRNQISSESDC